MSSAMGSPGVPSGNGMSSVQSGFSSASPFGACGASWQTRPFRPSASAASDNTDAEATPPGKALNVTVAPGAGVRCGV